uniref:Uncharacterized protein n=1 Tax=Lactuca sativa TaxID=4236 RepID=A0A9R1UEL1_LACSA|nr:hypothetical protein LSAT_V11C900462910 [Lactuca sativa]
MLVLLSGLVNEFKAPKSVEPNSPKDQFQWLYTNGLLGCLRSFIADYGVPLMVVDMGKVPPIYILVAFIPTVMIVGLYFFDHSVASMNKESATFYN